MDKEMTIAEGGTKKETFLDKSARFFTKSEGIISVVIFAVIFVYAILMCTPMANLSDMSNDTSAIDFFGEGQVKYAQPLMNVSPVVNNLMLIAIIGIVISAFYNLMRNNSRRIYYVSNKVYEIILIAYTVFGLVYLFYTVAYFAQQYSTIRFDILNATEEELLQRYASSGSEADIRKYYTPYCYEHLKISKYRTSTEVPAIGYVIFAIALINLVFLVFSFVKKLSSGKKIYNEIYSENVIEKVTEGEAK